MRQRALLAIAAAAVAGASAGFATSTASRPHEAGANGATSSRAVVAELREVNSQLEELNDGMATLNRRIGTPGADGTLTGTVDDILRVLGTNSYIPGTVRNLLRRICENVERPEGPFC